MPELELKAFAERLYGQAGVEQVLLTCQDELGLDVLMLLAACWLGWHGRMVPEADWREVIKTHEPWRSSVITPLRRVRRQLKSMVGDSALYRHTKQCELDAEGLQLERLERDLASHGSVAGASQACMNNLGACCQVQLGEAPGPRIAHCLARLALHVERFAGPG